jgi:hypothetical protein
MKIKNNHKSPIGFGTTTILPGDIGEVKTFEKNHPILAYYVKRGWVELIDDCGKDENDKQENDKQENDKQENDNDTAEVDDDIDTTYNTAGVHPLDKPIDKLNLDELKKTATYLGLTVEEADTRKVLIDKIKTAKKVTE